MMDLTRITKRPAASTRLSANMREVCQSLSDEKVGALAVVDRGRLVGIISERDIVVRVVAPGRDPQTTLVSEVMTAPVKTASRDITAREALELMHEGRFRHLPIVDEAGRLLGMISIRDLLRERIDELDMKNADLIAYISADGPGG
jgi:CBS domain-containing protein